ncbi:MULTISPECIES: hypothetical protein [unclassified Streptomyces]|uniref:hypothetical protein n=1 Tax=unclassified Streptomyces TaxID=2593676 RepID=UPI002365221D|nr:MULTISPECIES: hypothetical protein [unclassified Streptomyces]MDF3144778.1 hypothetical protein [Streptomyces sp. T21Q-yed]WDF37267.1 hypothetical protein PBV52_10955 [Streptomyces sp. T12]
MGRRLCVTEGTVEKYARSILGKLRLPEGGDDDAGPVTADEAVRLLRDRISGVRLEPRTGPRRAG